MEALEVPVFIGGHASVSLVDEFKRLGVHPLGTEIEFGLKQLNEVLVSQLT